jgi:hypothetical protein
MARFHTLERNLIGTRCHPMLLEREGNYVLERREAVIRAHKDFNEAREALEGLYTQHTGCACLKTKGKKRV